MSVSKHIAVGNKVVFRTAKDKILVGTIESKTKDSGALRYEIRGEDGQTYTDIAHNTMTGPSVLPRITRLYLYTNNKTEEPE